MSINGPPGLPRRLDLRPRLRAVRSQGVRPTCLAFAASAGHEMTRGPAEATLSPDYLVYAAMQRGAQPNAGFTMLIAGQSLSEAGQCQEELWPYQAECDCTAPEYAPSSAADEDARSRRIVGFDVVDKPDISVIKAAAFGARAAVLGVEYHLSARDLGPDARIPIPDPDEQPLGRHAYLVAGYDDDAQAVLLRNSWGPAWGDGGYGWLPYNYPDLFIYELLVFGY